MNKNISPEEKLLSIIRGKRNSPPASPDAADIKDVKTPQVKPWERVDAYILALLRNSFFKNNMIDPRVLKIFNKYAIIAIALLSVYIFMDIILVRPSRKAAILISSAAVPGKSIAGPEKTMPIDTKSYSYYSSKVSGKSVFSASSYVDSGSIEGAELSDDALEGSLGLVGIMTGENPQAIIEEKKNQKTYYLAKGQSINGITVQDIAENKVTLEYRGKKMTLSL